jgi:predicted GNAT family N-acyltransferase
MSKIIVFNASDKERHLKALKIRRKVFIEGQNVDEEIEVEHEDEATHFLLYYRRQAIGTARLRQINGKIKLERFAILDQYRGLGLGNDLLRFVINHARGYALPIYLNAQFQVVGYYQKWGFKQKGEAFYEANIKHYQMLYQPDDIKEKALSKAICRR